MKENIIRIVYLYVFAFLKEYLYKTFIERMVFVYRSRRIDMVIKGNLRLLVILLVFSCMAFFSSCHENLDKDTEPEDEWSSRMLEDGDQGVSIESPLYVYLGVPIDIATANTTTVRLYTANPSMVPGWVDFFSFEGESEEPFGLIFGPSCHLNPNTDYILYLDGLKESSGDAIPYREIRFTTGGVPADLENPFYCGTLALAWGLEDNEGINSGLIDDLGIYANVFVVGVPVYPDPFDPFPPNHLMINDTYVKFGERHNGGLYYRWGYLLQEPPYQPLITIVNEDSDPLDLGALTDPWVNIRPYRMEVVIDQMETAGAWTSSDPTNTPLAIDEVEMLQGLGCLRVGLNGANSEDDELVREWPAGEYAGVTDESGFQFAFKVANVTSGSACGLIFRIYDEDGDMVYMTKEVSYADLYWFFTTRLTEDFTEVVAVDGFDPDKITKISIYIDPNDIVGDLFLDFMTAGSLEDLKVWLPDEVIPALDFMDYWAPALPLYVGPDGSTYWARDMAGLHTVDLDNDWCDIECPLMPPGEAMTEAHLAQPAP